MKCRGKTCRIRHAHAKKTRRRASRRRAASRASRAASRGGHMKPMGVVVVRYYMIGCPHCIASEPAWEEFKKEGEYETEEYEANDRETQDDGITGFPTYVVKENKKAVRNHAGALQTVDDIKQELHLK
jgi:hypothetical protein